jgi:hypothetical protein
MNEQKSERAAGTAAPACSACGTVPDYDMGCCEFCDVMLCDGCGVHSERYLFCSQACADEWRHTWGEDVWPNAEAHRRAVARTVNALVGLPVGQGGKEHDDG